MINKLNDTEVISLFPISITKTNIGREFTKKELDFVDKLEKHHTLNEGNHSSLEGYVLDSEPFKDLKTIITNSLNNYIREIEAYPENVNIRLTQSWLNWTYPGQWHHKHSHDNSFLSGVLYINGEAGDTISFVNPNKRELNAYPPEEDLTWYNAKSWWIPAVTGEILIFPSNLQHQVAVRQSEGKRISLAFNSFLTGNLGNDIERTHLII